MADVEPDFRPKVSDKDFMEHSAIHASAPPLDALPVSRGQELWQCVNCGEWCTEKARPWCELHG